MACEVPCVVTNVGDAAEIVGHSDRVTASGDAIGMADALENLSFALQEQAGLGADARDSIMARYAIESIAAQYVTLWHDLLGASAT
jgi:glycosyltransferase involved in cell wall biosynthesis